MAWVFKGLQPYSEHWHPLQLKPFCLVPDLKIFVSFDRQDWIAAAQGHSISCAWGHTRQDRAWSLFEGKWNVLAKFTRAKVFYQELSTQVCGIPNYFVGSNWNDNSMLGGGREIIILNYKNKPLQYSGWKLGEYLEGRFRTTNISNWRKIIWLQNCV